MSALFDRPLHLGIIFALCLFALLYWQTGEQEKYYAESAAPWFEQSLSEISSWEKAALLRHLSAEAQATISNEQVNKLLDHYRPLGALQSMDPPLFSRLTAALSILGAKRVSYSTRAVFENGSAIVTATLLDSNGSYSFYNLNIGIEQ